MYKKLSVLTTAMVLSILIACVPGCTTNRINLADTGELSVQTVPSKRVEILWADVYQEGDNLVVSGVVQRFRRNGTPLKTHDVVVVTLGLKNLVMASPMKNTSLNCKYLMHGMGPWWLNYNMFVVAQRVRPQFTVIDGLEGMEGDGPIHGTRVEHGFALAGPDVVAVDRIAVDLMGFDIADIGYLNYCADAELGIIDRSKIKILGSKDPDDFVIKYKPHKAFKYQLYWKKDIAIEGWDPADLPY